MQRIAVSAFAQAGDGALHDARRTFGIARRGIADEIGVRVLDLAQMELLALVHIAAMHRRQISAEQVQRQRMAEHLLHSVFHLAALAVHAQAASSVDALHCVHPVERI